MAEMICCNAMKYHSSKHCTSHSSPFDCPDWLILHDETTGEYGIIVHDGGQSFVRIAYCPWCGSKLAHKKDI